MSPSVAAAAARNLATLPKDHPSVEPSMSVLRELLRERGLLTVPAVPSDAQREAAALAIAEGLREANLRVGNHLVASLITAAEYRRIAALVAEAVVGVSS